MQIRTLIIEDELFSQQLLHAIITEYCPSLKIVGTASNVAEGIALIHESKPDLVFMDIHLSNQLAFEVLDEFEDRNFHLIFTTAHEEYAIKAFKYEAMDYILKPYSPMEVIKALQKVIKSHLQSPNEMLKKLTALPSNVGSDRISFNTSEGINIIEPKNILYCTADGAYCKVYVNGEGLIMVSKPLGDVEQMLNQNQFIRIHASYLVNISHVKKYLKDDGGQVLMSDGSKIPISRRKKQEFLDIIRFE